MSACILECGAAARPPIDTVILLHADHFPQRCDQFFVLVHCSHRNADPFWQIIAFERPHDDFPSQQFLKHRTTVADVYHDEIRDAWDERYSHLGKLFLQISAAFVHNPFRLAQVALIVQRRKRAGKRDAVHVEWLSRLVKHFDYLRRPKRVTDWHSDKVVNFREGPQHIDVAPIANDSKRVGRVIKEFEIRLVENDKDAARYLRHKIVNRALENKCAGWIVWVRNEDESGFWRDRLQRCVEVLVIIRTRCFNRAHSESGREQFIYDKGVLTRDHFIARDQKCVTEKFDHFVRSIAEDYVFRCQAKFRSDCIA